MRLGNHGQKTQTGGARETGELADDGQNGNEQAARRSRNWAKRGAGQRPESGLEETLRGDSGS